MVATEKSRESVPRKNPEFESGIKRRHSGTSSNLNLLQYVLYRTEARFVKHCVRPQPLVMFQRLEDRIKALCEKAAATPDSPELTDTLQHLKAALAEHTRRMRKLAAGFPRMVRPERRSTNMPPPLHIPEAENGHNNS
jgi:hypothetical protein